MGLELTRPRLLGDGVIAGDLRLGARDFRRAWREYDAVLDGRCQMIRNVFRGFGRHDADGRQLEAILAAEIIKALDREGLSVRGAHGRGAVHFDRSRRGWP